MSNVGDEAQREREQQQALFDTLPEITLWAVVGPFGPSAVRFPPATDRWMNLKLIAWRIPSEPVCHVPMYVGKRLAEGELEAVQAAITSESVIALRAKLCLNGPSGDACAQLIGVLEPPRDAELEAALARFRAPVEMTDPILGRLVLNKSVDWFEGTIEWLGKPVEIAVCKDQHGSPADALRTAKALVERMRDWAAGVDGYALSQLLPLKNDVWLEEEEEPVSRADFLARMQLRSITVRAQGRFEFGHDDGDLFWGHSIQVSGSLEQGLKSAYVAG